LPDPYVWERYLLAIHGELVSYARPSLRLLQNLLENWMIEIRRSVDSPSGPSRLPARLARTKRFIDRNLDTSMTLDELARRAGLSQRHFCSEFRKYFRSPPIQYVIDLKMRHAAFLLGDRELSITEVGRAVGYENLYYFSRLFKKHYGVSPRAFRG
jgi:AraC-like DNA-binding protein